MSLNWMFNEMFVEAPEKHKNCSAMYVAKSKWMTMKKRSDMSKLLMYEYSVARETPVCIFQFCQECATKQNNN